MRMPFGAGILASLVIATPVLAGNQLIVAGQPVAVARSALSVTPPTEWNKLGARPGRNSETWTLDGDALNDLTFYGGIEPGKPIFRDVDKRDRPLPRMAATMLVTDVPALLENSYRIALGTPLFTLGESAPVRFAGRPGIRFSYDFTRADDELPRRGEAYAAIIGGKLYMATFEAPRLHFFDQSIEAARRVIESARL